MRALRYGDDEHYDVVSAFIKSIRGSDVDAGLYWLARMLEAGEDARFIARRLVILASEDVGMADPHGAASSPTAAAHAVEFVGLPEAQLNLAHAVVYLATAPKSNRHRRARRGDGGRPRPPDRCRSRPTCGTRTTRARRSSGTARATSILTTTPEGWVPQQYRPAEIAEPVYYRPTGRGADVERRPGRRPDRGARSTGDADERGRLAGRDGRGAARRDARRAPGRARARSS